MNLLIGLSSAFLGHIAAGLVFIYMGKRAIEVSFLVAIAATLVSQILIDPDFWMWCFPSFAMTLAILFLYYTDWEEE